jgi:hypothetical protein
MPVLVQRRSKLQQTRNTPWGARAKRQAKCPWQYNYDWILGIFIALDHAKCGKAHNLAK